MKLCVQKGFVLFIALVVTVCAFAQNNAGNGRQYSVSELKNDLTVLREATEKKYPDLYLYNSKPALDAVFDSLYNGITQPMTEQEFYKHITYLNSVIKNGHSYMLPSPALRDYNNKHEKFLPLHITWSENNMYVDMNCTADTLLPDGAQVVSINGTPAADVMSQLMMRQVRDGYDESYPLWILNHYFREYYSFIFGNPSSFVLQYKTPGSTIHTITVKALPKDSIAYYMQKKYATRIVEKKDGQGIFLETNKESTTAILTIKTFDNDELQDSYNQIFRDAVYKSFDVLKKMNTEKLVLDLRDNQGGDPLNGIMLLSFLLDEPFTMIYKGPFSGQHKPVKPPYAPYTGKLYVLVNGGSFSCTAMVCSTLEQHNRATFIGEETGGSAYIAGGDPEMIELPATKIQCQIATKPYVLRETVSSKGRGVIPAYVEINNIEDIIKKRDHVKQFAVSL